MKQLCLLIPAMVIFLCCPAQTASGDLEKAARLGQEAVQFMQAGENDVALKILRKAQRLDPDALFYPLQTAFAYYLKGKYRKAIDLLSRLQFHPGSNATVYALLHKCLLAERQKERATKTLEEGLKKFPASGQLCLEKALIFYRQGSKQDCMYWLSRGIMVDPAYGNNYLYRATLYFSEEQRTEAAMNAEMYLLNGDQLQAEIASNILYRVYSDSLRPVYALEDSSWQVQLQALSDRYIIGSLDSLSTNLFRFGTAGFLQSADHSLQEKLQANRIKVVQGGHLQAYLYGLFRYADPRGFQLWRSNNARAWQNFQEWRGRKTVLMIGPR